MKYLLFSIALLACGNEPIQVTQSSNSNNTMEPIPIHDSIILRNHSEIRNLVINHNKRIEKMKKINISDPINKSKKLKL